jgi:hypothetical protein
MSEFREEFEAMQAENDDLRSRLAASESSKEAIEYTLNTTKAQLEEAQRVTDNQVQQAPPSRTRKLSQGSEVDLQRLSVLETENRALAERNRVVTLERDRMSQEISVQQARFEGAEQEVRALRTQIQVRSRSSLLHIHRRQTLREYERSHGKDTVVFVPDSVDGKWCRLLVDPSITL